MPQQYQTEVKLGGGEISHFNLGFIIAAIQVRY